METISIRTQRRTELIEITERVQDFVHRASAGDGVCTVYVPHTTAGVTINENADPDVVHDMLAIVNRIIPFDDPEYRHGEGNSAAHIKASFFGSSVQVLVADGRLVLGRWQGIYFCEFDGPRSRSVHLRIGP